ncbi:MAG: UDP-N-acetylmuramoyl-L-alanyl-D-glutamate--2,6-diaminopimelate ligase [Alphaproteobacteria bacterium]
MTEHFDIRSVKGLTQDSRTVEPGYLFAALSGTKSHGADYIVEAVRRGAIAVLALEDLDASGFQGVEFIRDENPRRRFAIMASEFYGAQPSYIVAVTGTNGKTSTVHFVRQIWSALGHKAASIGTLGVEDGAAGEALSMTTPDPVVLHRALADMAKRGINHTAMEASSHGLDQYRLDGVRVRAAGFTNITQDHLDYHDGMGSYLEAKIRLFTDILEADGTAVLNADIEAFDLIGKIAAARGIKTISYGYYGRDLRISSLMAVPGGQEVRLNAFGQEHEFILPLPGEFQVMNVLCALGLVLAEEGVDMPSAIDALKNLKGVPGRLQSVPDHPGDAAIYIDYAHTPDALETILKSLRPHVAGKLVCVFGCGGDRDKSKRPLMGGIAAAFADRVIVTDDNPRTEDPATIRREILHAAPHAEEIGSRAEAIHTAIRDLQDGDVLVIAGKGHERGQIFNGRTEDFDDFKQAQKTLEELYS